MTRRTIVAAALLGLALSCTKASREPAQAAPGVSWPVDEATVDLWPPENCQVVWVATVTEFDGMEVELDIHESLKGDAPADAARLTLPRPIPRAISRGFFRDPKTGAYVASPPYEPLAYPYDPDRCGLSVGRRYLLYGLSTTDPESEGRTRAMGIPKEQRQEVMILPSRLMSRDLIELTDANRDEALAAARSAVGLAAIEDRTEQILAMIEALPTSGPILRGTLTRTLPGRLKDLPDKTPLVEPLLSLLDHRDPAIQLAALRAMNIDGDRRYVPTIPRRTPSEGASVSVVETSATPLSRLIELAMQDLPESESSTDGLGQDLAEVKMKAEVVHLAIGLVAIYDTPEALEAMLALAQHSDPSRRRLAAQLLAGFDSDRARQMQLALLDDPDGFVRTFALSYGLSKKARQGSFDSEVVIPKCIALLDDPIMFARRNAAEALGNSQDDRAVEALLARFMDPTTRHQDQRDICNALSVLYQDQVGVDAIEAHREQIVARMYTSGWALSEFAKLLKLMGTDEAMDVILVDSQSDSPTKREGVCRALTRFIIEPRAAEILIGLLDDPDPEVRSSAIYSIKQYTDHPLYAVATPKLIALLDDPDAKVRRNATDAMGFYIRREDAAAPIDKLIAMLKDPDKFVRAKAAQALGGCSDDRPVAPLLAVAGRAEGNACRALLRFYRNGIGVEQIDAHRNRFIRRAYRNDGYSVFVDLLGQIARDEAIQAFVRVASNPDASSQARRQACRALSRLRAPQVDEIAVGLLASDDPKVRRLGAAIIQNTRLNETLAPAVPVLIDLLDDPDNHVRNAAAGALRKDSPAVLEALLSGLSPQRGCSLAAREQIIAILARNCTGRRVSKHYVTWVARDIAPYAAVLNESTDAKAATHAVTLLQTIGTEEAITALQEVADNHPVPEIATLARQAVE